MLLVTEDEILTMHEAACSMGLDPGDFHVVPVSRSDFVGVAAYDGFEERFSHWSFVKRRERLAKIFQRLLLRPVFVECFKPTEPGAGYVLEDLPKAYQILTIAHYMGVSDFIRHNKVWQPNERRATMGQKLAENARTIDLLSAELGEKTVEKTITAARALQNQSGPWRPSGQLGWPPSLLGFIRNNSQALNDGAREILLIIENEWNELYLPQIETSIIEKGWASFFQKKLALALGLEAEVEYWVRALHVSVAESYSQDPRLFNEYFLGRAIFEDIERKNRADCQELFSKVRDECDDRAFLDQYLSPEVVAQTLLMAYAPELERIEGQHNKLAYRLRVQGYAETHFAEIKNSLVERAGVGQFPAIWIEKGLPGNVLYLQQQDSDLWLDLQWARKVVGSCGYLLGDEVRLKTWAPKVDYGSNQAHKDHLEIFYNPASGTVSFSTEPPSVSPAPKER